MFPRNFTARCLCRIGVLAWLHAASLPTEAAIFELVAITGENGFTAIENSASINDAGRVAFVASDASGQGIYFFDGSNLDKIARDTGFTYGRELQLNNSDDIAAVRIRGGSRSVRVWGTAVPLFSDLLSDEIAQATTTLPRTADLFQGLGDYASISNGGKVAFAGLNDSNVWEVHLSDTRVAANGNHPPIVSFPSNNVFRTSAANDDQVLIGSRQGSSRWVYRNSPALGDDRFQTIASTNTGAWANLGLRPGISDDGSAVAYFASGPAPVPPQIRLNFGSGDIRVESTDSTRSGSLFRKFQSFNADTRIGVNQAKGAEGRQLKLIYAATDSDGNAGIFVSRVYTQPTVNLISTYALAKVGDKIDGHPGLAITGLNLHDSINNSGEIAVWASTAWTSPGQPTMLGQAILKNDGRQLYNQYDDGRNSWHDQRVHPEKPGTFQDYGCTLAAVATIATWRGFDTDPMDVRNEALPNNLTKGDKAANFSVGDFRLQREHAVLEPQRASQHVPFAFTDIVAELRDNRPVLLKVPSFDSTGIIKSATGLGLTNADGSYRVNNAGHYVVALNIMNDTGGEISAAQIRIHDPGHGEGPGQKQFADKQDLRLEDYFSKASNVSSAGTFDAKAWFDNGQFLTKAEAGANIPLGANAAISSRERPLLITKFVIQNQRTPGASLSVNSPVDLVITAGGSNQRYVTSSDIQQPGDILLSTVNFDDVAPFDENVMAPDPTLFADQVPHFTVSLPSELLGQRLNLDILGVASGEYAIKYNSLDGRYTPTGPITGITAAGMISSGQFDVSPNFTVIPGDYDGNGVVAAADYTVWRDTLGQLGTGLAADGNSNGEVEDGDYMVWKMHFGEAALSVGNGQRVPEPAALMMCWPVLIFAIRTLARHQPARGEI